MSKAVAIITGASSGMGWEFVRQIDRNMHHIHEIWMIARREERLNLLAENVMRCNVRCICLDLCRESAWEQLDRILETEQPDVRMLVNAAGVGRSGVFAGITRTEAVNMIDLNARALTAVTHTVLPYMSKHSRIIQMCSASAFFPQKEFSVYAASKTFVLRFSMALQAELKDRCIAVTIVCTGPVDTEFLEIANKGRSYNPFKKLVMVKPEPVVRKALTDAGNKKKLSIYGIPMKLVYAASMLLPHV